MTDWLLEWLDSPVARLLALFLLCLGLLALQVAGTADPDAATTFMAPLPADPGVEVRRAPSFREIPWQQLAAARGAPPPPRHDPRAREAIVTRVRADLVRAGVRGKAVTDMMVAYADKTAWLDAKAEYEAALGRKDLAGATRILTELLAKLTTGGPMLKRDILEALLPLQIAAGDVAAAEATFRGLTAIRVEVAAAWMDELRANPALAKARRIDPNAPLNPPDSESIARAFAALARRAQGGRNPLTATDEEWAELDRKMAELTAQGKLSVAELQAARAWRANLKGGRP